MDLPEYEQPSRSRSQSGQFCHIEAAAPYLVLDAAALPEDAVSGGGRGIKFTRYRCQGADGVDVQHHRPGRRDVGYSVLGSHQLRAYVPVFALVPKKPRTRARLWSPDPLSLNPPTELKKYSSPNAQKPKKPTSQKNCKPWAPWTLPPPHSPIPATPKAKPPQWLRRLDPGRRTFGRTCGADKP